MSQPQESLSPDNGQEAKPGAQQPQQESDSERHAGQGSESAMKQMRVWEQLRASNSGGNRGR